MKAAGVLIFTGGLDDAAPVFSVDAEAARLWARKIAVACGWPQEVRRFLRPMQLPETSQRTLSICPVPMRRSGEPLRPGDFYLRHLVLGVALWWCVVGILMKFIGGLSWPSSVGLAAVAWAACTAILVVKNWSQRG